MRKKYICIIHHVQTNKSYLSLYITIYQPPGGYCCQFHVRQINTVIETPLPSKSIIFFSDFIGINVRFLRFVTEEQKQYQCKTYFYGLMSMCYISKDIIYRYIHLYILDIKFFSVFIVNFTFHLKHVIYFIFFTYILQSIYLILYI